MTTEFAGDLPGRYVPQDHRLVSAARTQLAVIKRAMKIKVNPVLATPLSMCNPKAWRLRGREKHEALTRLRPAPRSRGRCTSSAALLGLRSTASGFYRRRTSESSSHQLENMLHLLGHGVLKDRRVHEFFHICSKSTCRKIG